MLIGLQRSYLCCAIDRTLASDAAIARMFADKQNMATALTAYVTDGPNVQYEAQAAIEPVHQAEVSKCYEYIRTKQWANCAA